MPFKLNLDAFKRAIYADSFLSELQKKHMQEKHWHIGPLAVEPKSQRKGLGKALLNSFLKDPRFNKSPFYGQTFKEEISLFLRKLDFKLLEKTKLPNTNLTIWSMVLEPKN
ncbi:MAG: GNAT family N-acetyltransferase [Candidatus Lokiarchaeota archaeon]|nr:GNAT family N-acetyltransferase [Candidatus Lokiarchaeota archaeon]